MRRRDGRRIKRHLGPRRSAGDDVFDARDFSRNDVHERTGRVAGQPSGDITANPFQGTDQAPCQDAGHHLQGVHFPLPLGLVEFFNVRGRHLERVQHLGVENAIGRLDLPGRDLQVFNGDVRFVLFVPAQALVVPVPAQSRKNGADVFQHFGDVRLGAIEQMLPPFRGKFVQIFQLEISHPVPLAREFSCKMNYI